ncbi:MAG: hypothetical protein HYW07_08630 [Candidatus Latescibacteria bacterium]|nr:hypothetical protein [Candidatus Latescibacterota bacterium]
MKKILFDDLYLWSVFNETRQLDFNGHLWVRPEGNVLVDPVAMIPSDLEQLEQLGGAAWIVLTNTDHERQAAFFRQRTGAKILVHALDAGSLAVPVERSFADGEEIVPGLVALHLRHGKSPGEVALYWPQKKLVLSGDLVVGAPVGRISLLMDEKLQDPPRAALEVRKLLALDFAHLLVGDGHAVLHQGRERLLECLEERGDIYINNEVSSLIVVHPDFDRIWPFAADHFRQLWQQQGEVEFIRVGDGEQRPLREIAAWPGSIRRLACLGVRVELECLRACASLREATFQGGYSGNLSQECRDHLQQAGVRVYNHPSEGFWGQTVAEYGLALTLCGLRRIPQLHHQILSSLEPWHYDPPGGQGRPGARGQQFGDDSRFASGTLAGKRVRVVGAGNIASRYASFAHFLGAEVAAWDPFASEPCFHRAGARREWHLERLVQDAEVFAPMVPLTDSTRDLVKAHHIEALPKGCLVVLVTRARICDTQALRRRVLADELSLAADVWDVEPLPLDDPLLGRPNVVHTPHNAGRTTDANCAWAEKLAEQFLPAS